jgi:hypothetical protein
VTDEPTPQTFRIKPFAVEAMAWQPATMDAVKAWLDGYKVAYNVTDESGKPVIVLMESGSAAAYGWWVLRMPNGHTVGMRPELLAESYIEVTDANGEYCRRCGSANIVWTAPSPLWNAVMRGGSINGEDNPDGIVCPVCFAQLAEYRKVASLWRFYAERVHVPLETVTPSGRVWDPETWMWREPESGVVS